MQRFSRIVLFLLAAVSATFLPAGMSEAGENSDEGYENGLAFTVGEGAYFINNGVYRSPVSLEMVPSFGWSWFKFDLGMSTTLESLRIADTNVGYWNFTFSPGARMTPPMIPLYIRGAFPLRFQQRNFDWGWMFGLGADIHLVGMLGLVLETDATLSKDLKWGAVGLPVEFRAGFSLHF